MRRLAFLTTLILLCAAPAAAQAAVLRGRARRRLRPRHRHEPVRLLRLRPEGLQLPADPVPLLLGHQPDERARQAGAGAAPGQRPVRARARRVPRARGRAPEPHRDLRGQARERRPRQPDRQGQEGGHLRLPAAAVQREADAADGPRHQRPAQRHLPRIVRAARRRRRWSDRRERPAHRRLHQGRDRGRDAVLVAPPGAARPGGDGAHLRAVHQQDQRRGVRPVPRHPLAGLPRRVRGDVGQQHRRGRHLAPDPDLRRQAGGDLLLLDLRRQDRERRELVRGLVAQAVAEEQGRPLRHDLAQAPLALPLLPLVAGRQAGRARALREDPRDPARAVAPDRACPGLREQGHEDPDRAADPRPPGPVRHVGVLQHRVQLTGREGQGEGERAPPSPSWAARSTPPRAAAGCWSSGASAGSGRASRGCTPRPGADTGPRSRPRASTACARAPWPAPPCASASPGRPGGRRPAGCRTRSAARGRRARRPG